MVAAMKRILLVLAGLALALTAGCSGGAKDTLTGSAEEVLAAVIEQATAALPEGHMPVGDIITVTDQEAQGRLGLALGDYTSYVAQAAASVPMLSTSAYEIAVVKVTDMGQVADAKAAIAAGFDSGQWVCVMPEQSIVIESGSYILLAVGTTEVTDAVVAAFTSLADGNVGTANTFFTAG
jgi:hypothetical protein